MIIKSWGSRGSIPVSGPEYIKYGGDTTCIEITTKNKEIIIIDAGTGIRRLGNRLVEQQLFHYHLLFTHAHWDHLMGLPFFKPLFLNDTVIDVYRCPSPGKYAEQMIAKIMTPPHFPIRYDDLKARITYKKGCPDPFTIGSVTVTPINLSHPGGGSGYKFTEDGKSFIFLTDNELGYVHEGGLMYNDYLEFTKDADLLIHDAEYTPEEYDSQIDWGHSVYTDALSLAISANVTTLGLFHLNQNRTDRQVDAILNVCHRIIDEQGKPLQCVAVDCNMSFEL
jgi:phosphoribosyl 1,2-cyclic phosphodiesterase